MATVGQAVPKLVSGEVLPREILRRWEGIPQLKRAELIRGVVYMPSPLGIEHGEMDNFVGCWLGLYRAATPGTQTLNNATWLMGPGDAPQPDAALRVLPEYGGQSRTEGSLAAGAPEFVAEICHSSASYDLHEKRDLYEEAGVREYLAVLLQERTIRWHRKAGDRFEVISPLTGGVYHSEVFPGLWLDAPALLRRDLARVLAVLQEGIASPEHAQLVEHLATRRQAS